MTVSSTLIKNQLVTCFSEFLFQNGLEIFPLHSVSDGKCTCKLVSCTSQGKHPLFRKNWKHVASSDMSRMIGWLSSSTNNVAVATGKFSEKTHKFLVVIDVDSPEHPLLQELPKTFRYRTGRSGHHLWYWSKFPIANSVSKLAPSVDIRGQNGYVVIPPSRHVSGNSYLFDNLNPNEVFCEIADLPQFVIDRLDFRSKSDASQRKVAPSSSSSKKKLPSTTKGTVTVKTPFETLEKWSICSVSDIRAFLLTEKIPVGVRNNVIHRLLSSDRARGASETTLWTNARKYVSQCEGSADQPITDFELSATISQVLKYSAYNTSHEKVNETFFAYMSRSKKQLDVGDEEKKKIVTADEQFFRDVCKPAQGGEFLSLECIAKARETFMQRLGLVRYSKYPPPLLAKKLQACGFIRKRTNRGNIWNVAIVPLNGAETNATFHNSLEKYDFKFEAEFAILKSTEPALFFESIPATRINMSTISGTTPSIPTTATSVPAGQAAGSPASPGVPPVQSLPSPLEDDEGAFEEKIIKVTVKKHPSEKRYCGRVNRDSNDALMKFTYMLSDLDRKAFFDGVYVHDEEATAAEFDAILPGDRVGILLQYENGWIPTIVDVSKVENDVVYGTDFLAKDSKGFSLLENDSVEFTFEDVSSAMCMGYFEILYRPDPNDNTKMIPYGIEREREIKSLIPVDPSSPSASGAPATASSPTPPPAPASSPQASAPPSMDQIPSTPEELAQAVAGAGLTADQIKALGEGLGIDMTAKGPAVGARGRGAQAQIPADETDSGSANSDASSTNTSSTDTSSSDNHS